MRSSFLYSLVLAAACLATSTSSSAQATVAPTLVKDLEANGGSDPKDFCVRSVTGSKLFFTANVGGKRDLFCTDGTTAGTVRVTNLQDNITSTIGAASYIFFTTESKKLYKTDGSANGTVMLKQFGAIDRLNGDHLPGKLLFSASLTTDNNELWSSDGTVSNTVFLKDLDGTWGSKPRWFVLMAGKVYFAARLNSAAELWVSDGTAAGTSMVIDLPNGTVYGLGKVNNRLYFCASDNGGGINAENIEPWVSDGTTAGTRKFLEINTQGSSHPQSFTGYGGLVYFRATDHESGTSLLNSNGERIHQYVHDLTVHGSKLYYVDAVSVSASVNKIQLFALDRPAASKEILLPGQLPTKLNAPAKPAPPVKVLEILGPRTPQGVTCDVLQMMSCASTEKLFLRKSCSTLDRYDPSTNTRSAIQPSIAPASSPVKSDLFYYNGFVYFAGDYTNQGAELYKVQ